MNTGNVYAKYERCVVCGKLTDIPTSLPIDFREEYEIGCGQMCSACRIKMREENKLDEE